MTPGSIYIIEDELNASLFHVDIYILQVLRCCCLHPKGINTWSVFSQLLFLPSLLHLFPTYFPNYFLPYRLKNQAKNVLQRFSSH